jgi:hypothetical protein
MCKFLILVGKNSIPGTAGTSYNIHDAVTFDPKKDIENQMRKYAYRYFYNKGRKAKLLRKEVFCRRRHIIKGDGSIFAERIKIFDHETTNEYVAFVPKECFDW